jgi:hypothetical protein
MGLPSSAVQAAAAARTIIVISTSLIHARRDDLRRLTPE